MTQAKIRKIRWWQRFLDPDVRVAKRRLKSSTLQTVDYTDGGIAITMPAEVAELWETLPLEERDSFRADIDRMNRAASGLREWQGP